MYNNSMSMIDVFFGGSPLSLTFGTFFGGGAVFRRGLLLARVWAWLGAVLGGEVFLAPI